MKRILVTGAGGFIGSHLVRRLKKQGHWVRGVDLKWPEFSESPADDFRLLDLRNPTPMVLDSFMGIDEVYALAADMGGMGFISQHHVEILDHNLRINLNTAQAAFRASVGRVFFSSSACIYPIFLQRAPMATPLKESDAYPAQPEDAYGWEKLTAEKIYLYHAAERAFQVRIARFHNIYGPEGAWRGGREKAPAALCRKIAQAKIRGEEEIEVWGDGQQTRSFCYIDDCLEGFERLMASDYSDPLNIGSDFDLSIAQLAQIIGDLAGWPVRLRFVAGPQGVRGRNSDNSLATEILDGWEPAVSLEKGLETTYQWIEGQVIKEAQCAA